MTVGIAACAFYERGREKEKAIILCCDWQATTGHIKSDDTDKTRWIDGATALISGTPTEADELFNASQPAIKKFLAESDPLNTDLHISTLQADLRQASQKRKRELMSEHFALAVGMGYDEFVARGKNEFHQSHYDLLWAEAHRLTLGASILYAMFDAGGEPVLILQRQDGKVRWEDQFSTIGTGGEIAHILLSMLEFDSAMTFLPCLYEVHRAKVAAEADIYVGKATTFEILLPGGRRFDLADDLFKYMNRKVRTYKTPKLTFGREYLATVK